MKLPIEDRYEINELLAKYYLANDEKDIEAALSCCTEDATISGDFTMRSDYQEEDLKKIYAGEPGKKRHLMLNPIILSYDGNTVEMQHLMLVIEASLFPATVATSKVTDKLVKNGSDWKISEHIIEVDPSGKWIVNIGKSVQNMIETIKEKFN